MPNVMAAQPNIGGAVCESSVIPFLVPRLKVWLTPTGRVPCSNAANIGERKTWTQSEDMTKLDGCIVWNVHNTVLGEEARLYIVPVCYIKTGRYGKPSNIIISLHRKKFHL